MRWRAPCRRFFTRLKQAVECSKNHVRKFVIEIARLRAGAMVARTEVLWTIERPEICDKRPVWILRRARCTRTERDGVMQLSPTQ